MPITNIGRVPVGSPPSGDFYVTDISKTGIQVIETNYQIDFSWAAPTGGADRYLVEFYEINTLTTGPTWTLRATVPTTTNSVSLNVPKASKYGMKITSYRGIDTSYVIIEEIVKLEETSGTQG